MELLRNYQVRRQLGLIDSELPRAAYDQDDIRRRISESYQRTFGTNIDASSASPAGAFPPSSAQAMEYHASPMRLSPIPARSRVSKGAHDGSPRVQSRNISESEYIALSAEIQALQEEVSHLRLQKDAMSLQIEQLQRDAPNGDSSEALLHRLNVSSPRGSSNQILEKKLEIYRQQIVKLSGEVARLSGESAIS